MDSNTDSTGRPAGPGTGHPDRVASLVAAVDELAAAVLDGLAETALAEEFLELQRLLDRLDGQCRRGPAGAGARGAAGADHVTSSPRRRRGCGGGCGWARGGPGAALGAARALV